MRFPLVPMTMLGLGLVAYGLMGLLKKNPVLREEVMKRLSNENRTRLASVLNTNVDLTGQLNRLKQIEALTENSVGPKGPPPQTGSTHTTASALDPTKATTAETLTEIKRLQQERNEALKSLGE